MRMQYQEMVNQQKALMNASFEQGKQAYSRGRYTSSVGLFKKALDEEGPFTGMGGDIQIWLALAYEVKPSRSGSDSTRDVFMGPSAACMAISFCSAEHTCDF